MPELYSLLLKMRAEIEERAYHYSVAAYHSRFRITIATTVIPGVNRQ